jgi:NAD(P)H-nitrite reductase large subunit
MDLDDEVCCCFHVTRRKLINFCRRERPIVPSQMSLCGGAGTGCGWCVPFLKQIYRQVMEGVPTDLDQWTADQYVQQRAAYLRSGKGKPPGRSSPVSGDDTSQQD